MATDKRIVSAQLRVGDTELPTYRIADVLAKLDAARKYAGLTRLLFLPSHNQEVNDAIIRHCRKSDIELYLWYKMLADNDIMAERSELVTDAFGKSGVGESGVWGPIFDAEETYLFCCPRTEKYNNLLLNRCGQLLENYDGLFIDNIGYPLPSLGLEGIFTCFCPYCRSVEPRLEEWRKNVHDLRESMVSASDEDVEGWGTFYGQAKAFGLTDFYTYRTDLITGLTKKYADLARSMGKGFGIDVLSPALVYFAGHNLGDLGAMADWIKPRIYCHTYGPTSIPLEFYCLAMGAQRWYKRASSAALMEFISRSIDLDLPRSLHKLTHTYLSTEAAHRQINMAVEMSGGPVHPGIECSLHPDYETSLDDAVVAGYLEGAADTPGLVLCWNLLFIPDAFLRLVGKTLG